MKGPSKPSKWKVAVSIKQGILKWQIDVGNVSVSGSGDWPVWKNRVKNETRTVVWDQIMGGLEWPTALWCYSFGSWESWDFCPEEQKMQKGDDLTWQLRRIMNRGQESKDEKLNGISCKR